MSHLPVFLQTFGQLVHFHPHIHALVTDGMFLPDLSACGHAQADSTFLALPKAASDPFLKRWEQEIFDAPERGHDLPTGMQVEKILGHCGLWEEMRDGYGDWGRDGTLAVATRHLGWRLVEVIGQVAGLSYAAGAQGIRRFWRQAEGRAELADLARRLRENVNSQCLTPCLAPIVCSSRMDSL